MNNSIRLITEEILYEMITEAPAQETDNTPDESENPLFSSAEEKFLGKFDAYGTTHIGIIYSVSDIGIREFISRSGKDLNLTPGILLSLLQRGVIKIVPYTGYGKNNDYTLELQLSLSDVEGLGAEDKEKIEKGTSSAGAPPPAGETPPPPTDNMEVAWIVKYGTILQESTKIVKQLITESNNKKNTSSDTKLIDNKTRVLHKLPVSYIRHMLKIIQHMDTKGKSSYDKQRFIADVLDVLQYKLNLTPKQIGLAYDYHKNQKRLQKYLEKK